MPEIIDEPDLTQNVSYTLMASAIGKEAYVLARPAETPLANLIKTISKGRLTAFACFVRDLPNGKCTFQVVLDLKSGKSIRATISTSDVSATPRKWMLRRIDLADMRADFTTDGDILSLETRIPFSGRNVKALQSIAPVDREFRGLIDMSSKALNGELLETVLSESKNGQRVWKAILGGDSIADYAGALDCTSKFHGYKLEYRIVKDGAVEQIAARKGFAVFRFSGDNPKRGQACGHGQRIAGERTCLIDRAGRRNLCHDVLAAAVGCNGQTTADDFTQAGQIRRDAVGCPIVQFISVVVPVIRIKFNYLTASLYR